MYCKHCGSQVPDGARFCMNCTAPIGEDTTGGYGTTDVQPSQIYQPQPSQRGRRREQNSQQYATSPYVVQPVQYIVQKQDKNPLGVVISICVQLFLIALFAGAALDFIDIFDTSTELAADYVAKFIFAFIAIGLVTYIGVLIYRNIRLNSGYAVNGATYWYKKWWVWVLLFSLAVASSTVQDSVDYPSSTSTSTSTSTSQQSAEKYNVPVVTKSKYELIGTPTDTRDMFAIYINGTIRNNTSRTCSYLQVTFNLYDAAGNQVGTAFDNITNLEAGGTWRFKAMGINDDSITSYRLAEIEGY